MKYGMSKSSAAGAIRSAKAQNSYVVTTGGGRYKAKQCNFKIVRVAGGKYTPIAKRKR